MLGENVVFRGTDRNEALQFISAIRKKALEIGKRRDYEWMADFASGCIEGEAVIWYENLDIEVQENWTLLSRELLSHWAQAVPGGAELPPTPVSGVIKVISNDSTSYLSRNLIKTPVFKGALQITSKLDYAVRVTFQRSDGVHEIRFENDFPDYPRLGFHFNNPAIDLYTESNLWGYLTPYEVTSTGSILMPQNRWTGSGGHRVAPSQWRVGEDGVMRPYVLDDQTHTSKEMNVMLDINPGMPYITHNAPKWLKAVLNASAQLVFESC